MCRTVFNDICVIYALMPTVRYEWIYQLNAGIGNG